MTEIGIKKRTEIEIVGGHDQEKGKEDQNPEKRNAVNLRRKENVNEAGALSKNVDAGNLPFIGIFHLLALNT